MSATFYLKPELVIALNKKAIFVNPNDLQIFKEVELPEDLAAHIKTPTIANGDDVEEPANGNKSGNKSSEKLQQPPPAPSIQHVLYAPNGQLLAVTTAGQKALLLYHCRLEHAKLLSVRELPRAASALAFANDSKALLVTDKSGDCYQYDCVDVEAPPRLILGHLAIVYDVIWTPDQKFVITCDRDDKIRVTNYPQTYDIHTYCLGHKEFVSGLALLGSHSHLLSASGDGTLRIWNYESGKELHKFNLPAPALRLHLCEAATTVDEYIVGVQLYQPQESIGLYKIKRACDDTWHTAELKLLNFGDAIVTNFCFVEQRIYVTSVVNERLALQAYNIAGEICPTPENWLDMVRSQYADDAYAVENYAVWFKKRYDNVSEYLERKRRRIEEKQKEREQNDN